jgi:multidrug efflux pump subunit AcrA (membrane-fusion protein)
MTDSSDLVERLRKGRSANEWVSEELAREAAATIQRLEAERAEAYEKGRESAFEEIGNYYLMRKDCQDALAKAQAAITALQSERDRLREALAEIEKMGGAYEDAYQEVGRLRSIARAALAGKGSDLVERLRIHGSPINLEAAATIQRLEADNQAWKEAWEREHAHCNAYNEEITALQSERDEWRLALENIRDGHTFGIKPSEIARAALTHAPIAAGGGENVSVRSPGWEPVKPGEWPLENVKPSSSDLVERLRREAESKSALRHNDWDLLVEAADTIECLSARIKELEAKHG